MVEARRNAGLGAAISLLLACEVHGFIGSNAGGDGTGGSGPGDEGSVTTPATGSADDAGTVADDGPGETTSLRFDVALPDAPASCEPPTHDPCDDDDDPIHALGMGCPGDATVHGSFRGHSSAMMVHRGVIGTSGEYGPREGERFVVLSTGKAGQLPRTPAQLQIEDPSCNPLQCPSTQLSDEVLGVLPSPIDVRSVSDSGVDCSDDPSWSARVTAPIDRGAVPAGRWRLRLRRAAGRDRGARQRRRTLVRVRVLHGGVP
ncbi:MAG: hypothetical protein IPN32_10390 [Deltaproteobacteria bacterium]|nr:hypothetical protein [Deltaproteobacteria bacterium]